MTQSLNVCVVGMETSVKPDQIAPSGVALFGLMLFDIAYLSDF